MNKKQNAKKGPKVNLIKLSADVHKRDYKICRQIGDQNLQPTQTFDPEAGVRWALQHLDEADRVVFCYEAGFSGFGVARRLIDRGVEVVVMCPQRLDERCKGVNTDKRDARAIAGRLDRYLAGNTEALVAVRIPSELEEDQRALSRQRQQMLKARQQFEAQGRGLLHFKGLACPVGWWRGEPEGWERVVKLQGWPAGVVQLLEGYRRMALMADAEVTRLSQLLEEAAAKHLPPSLPSLPYGFGGLSMEIIRREVCSWNRFGNRGQVGSFFGMVCGENSSGNRRSQGSITKTGNSRGRHALLELAWRVLQFQPDYRLVKKFKPRIDAAKPRSVARKKLIVALARQLAVDLWRLYTGRTTAEKLGLRLHAVEDKPAM